jgi:hypothetical protein
MYQITDANQLLDLLSEGPRHGQRCCGRFMVRSILGDLFCGVCGHAPLQEFVGLECWSCGGATGFAYGQCDECGDFIELTLDNLSIGGWTL